MAVNHADGTMLISLPFYPIAAAIGAAGAGAGWFSLLFIPAGLAIGMGLIYLGRKMVYSIVGYGLRRASKLPNTWIRQIFFAPFFLLYFILPLANVSAGVFGLCIASSWVVEQFS